MMIMKYICIVLVALHAFTFSVFTNKNNQTIGVNQYETHQTFETFGTSSCWWSQTISDEETAREIARLLYDDETGLGLDVYRYNIGGGEADNPDCRIWDVNRRTESFYVMNPETGEYEYDFSRDVNAIRMLDMAVEYGAEEIILFCNSPHFSMTSSGHASGGLEANVSNLPKENYEEFVDYLLTIADWFVAEGYPVTAISPINEPQWSWGGEWVGQEGCHYTADEAVELLELFAVTMKERNSPYKLSGPESGELSPGYYEYIDKFFASEILNEYCDTYAGHSYWIDNRYDLKTMAGNKFRNEYPDKKLEMSEWCELPMTLNPATIDSGLYMANIIVQDLNLLGAVSWQSWTAVNGDGVLDIVNGEVIKYNRYYAYKHFSQFIENGMTRVTVMDSFEDKSNIASTAFRGNGKTVFVLINNSEESKDIKLYGLYKSMDIHRTDAITNCEKIYSGDFERNISLSGKSITTIVLEEIV